MKEITLKVEGMVCGGCEKRVVNALKMIEQVSDVVASHEKGQVTISLNGEVSEKEITEKIEDLGFEVVKED